MVFAWSVISWYALILMGVPLNHQSLVRHQDISELNKALAWSLECNHRIKEKVIGMGLESFEVRIWIGL